eukprot:CAMPEP_0172440168 /NCGR_PEP_ID=MMETSP1065-20121228/900_1 /TAXON_ID=265537 /ORGANISM="Amphiprora paludosa, Strain CCMP125" /LENGTH=219 /DNA_ID=CAMNT_0013188951 /DNA_START=117 /DNA_END=776 /DNA_ORIENTATION=-
MGFLKIFSKKSLVDVDDKVSVSSRTSLVSDSASSKKSSKSATSSSRSSKTHQNKKLAQRKSDLSNAVPELTPNEQVISDYLSLLNQHGAVEDMLQFFASPDVKVTPEDSPSASAQQFAEILRDCYLSFQDMTFDGHDIKEVKPGVVLLEDNVVRGTHTGQPYQPLPSLEPVPASGKQVILDPERVFFTMEEGKIVDMQVLALGCHTGVVGLYVLAGGKL